MDLVKFSLIFLGWRRAACLTSTSTLLFLIYISDLSSQITLAFSLIFHHKSTHSYFVRFFRDRSLAYSFFVHNFQILFSTRVFYWI